MRSASKNSAEGEDSAALVSDAISTIHGLEDAQHTAFQRASTAVASGLTMTYATGTPGKMVDNTVKLWDASSCWD